MLELDASWVAAAARLRAELASLAVSPPTTTGTLHPVKVTVDEAKAAIAELNRRPRATAAFRGSADPDDYNLYFYDNAEDAQPEFASFLWLKPHSHLSAWCVISA